jgi:hypothetical protein
LNYCYIHFDPAMFLQGGRDAVLQMPAISTVAISPPMARLPAMPVRAGSRFGERFGIAIRVWYSRGDDIFVICMEDEIRKVAFGRTFSVAMRR